MNLDDYANVVTPELEALMEKARLRAEKKQANKKPSTHVVEESHIPLKKQLEIAGEVEHEKKRMQCLTLDRLQWYRIEFGKVKCVDHEVLDWIVEGGGIFINRSMRQSKPRDMPEIEYNPTVKTKYPIKYFLRWDHNQKLPSFITYAATTFKHNDLLYRHADADLKQMKLFLGDDFKEFKRILDLVCERNLDQSTPDKLIPREDYKRLKGMLSDGARKVEDLMEGVMKVDYSGNGFRILVRSEDRQKLEERINGYVKAGYLDPCSNDLDYRAMRLNSFQSVKPTFQTGCDPRKLEFRYSNPAFFELRINDFPGLKELLFQYYRSWIRTGADYPEQGATYMMMRTLQTSLEEKIKGMIELKYTLKNTEPLKPLIINT